MKILFMAQLMISVLSASAFTGLRLARRSAYSTSKVVLRSTIGSDDSTGSEPVPIPTSAPVEEPEPVVEEPEPVVGVEEEVVGYIQELRAISAASDRGAMRNEVRNITDVISSIEAYVEPWKKSQLVGEWELLYTDDDITRSSPFFWAFRKLLKGIDNPVPDPLNIVGNGPLAESIFKVTDSIPAPLKEIGICRQMFTPSGETSTEGDLVSQVEIGVKLGIKASSLMTTTSSWKSTADPEVIEIRVDQTKVLESTLGRFLPFVDDKLSFPSGAAMELARPGSSTVFMRVTYLDDDIRVCRNEADDKVFVYQRV